MFKVLHHFSGVHGRRGHDVVIFRKARARTVVHDETILSQHESITDLTNRQC
jgi:hypothetical protein